MSLLGIEHWRGRFAILFQWFYPARQEQDNWLIVDDGRHRLCFILNGRQWRGDAFPALLQ